MRAKYIVVVVVLVLGLLGGVVITASATEGAPVVSDDLVLTVGDDLPGHVPAMRDGGPGGGAGAGDGDGGGNTQEGECNASHAVVAVNVLCPEELPILGLIAD